MHFFLGRVSRRHVARRDFTKNGGSLAVVDYQGAASTTPNVPPVGSGETQASLMFDGKHWWVASDTW